MSHFDFASPKAWLFRIIKAGAAMAVLPVVSPLLLGGAERYRSISAATVATAMAALTRSQRKGVTRHTHRGIMQLASPGRRA